MSVVKEMCYKELAPVITEAEKSPDLELVSWRPGRTEGRCSSPSTQTQEDLVFQLKSKGGRRPMCQHSGRKSSFLLSLSVPGMPSTDWTRPTHTGTPGPCALLSLLIQTLVSSGGTLTDKLKLIFDQTNGWELCGPSQ